MSKRSRTWRQDVDHLPDSDLMNEVRDGNTAAFDTLITRHQDALVNFFARLGVHKDMQDLAQETFLRIYRRREHYTPRAKFTTYLYTVARSCWIDWTRRQARQTDGLRAYSDEQAVRAAVRQHGPPDLAYQAADAAAALPNHLREVVVLSIYQGLKYREIAEILDIPEGTVKSRMSTAMRTLKEVLHASQHA